MSRLLTGHPDRNPLYREVPGQLQLRRRPPFWGSLSVYLHADRGVVQSGSDLTTWTDQKAGKVGTGVGLLQVNDTGFNGRRSIHFDDDTNFDQAVEFLDSGGNGAWGKGDGIQTIIIALNHAVGSTDNLLCGPGTTDWWQQIFSEANVRSGSGQSSESADIAGEGVEDFTGEAVHVLRCNGALVEGWFNGAPYSENPYTITNGTQSLLWDDDVHVGNRASHAANAMIGHYRIVLFYDAYLTNAQINKVVNDFINPETGLSSWVDLPTQPPFFSDLAIWLHADLGVVRATDDLTTWKDQKSGKTGLAATGAGIIQVNDTGFNGLRSLTVDDASQIVNFEAAVDDDWLPTGVNQATFFCAFNPTLAASNSSLYSNVNNQGRVHFTSTDKAAFRDTGGTGYDVDLNPGNIPDFTGEAIHVHRWNGVVVEGWRNGTPYSQNPFTMALDGDWFGDCHLMNDGAQAIAGQGEWRHFLVYNGALTDVQINTVIDYLNGECGLTTPHIQHPSDVDGLLVYLSADLGIIGDITSWTDQQSGFVGIEQEGGGGTIELDATGFNGKAAVKQSGGDAYISFTGAANRAWSSSKNWTVICAANFNIHVDSFDTIFGRDSSGDQYFLEFTEDSSGGGRDGAVLYANGTGGEVDGAGIAQGVLNFEGEGIHVWRTSKVVVDGDTFDGWMNGVAFSNNIADENLPNPYAWYSGSLITLFARGDGTDSPVVSQMRVFLFYDRTLTDAEINTIVNDFVDPHCGTALWSDI